MTHSRPRRPSITGRLAAPAGASLGVFILFIL